MAGVLLDGVVLRVVLGNDTISHISPATYPSKNIESYCLQGMSYGAGELKFYIYWVYRNTLT